MGAVVMKFGGSSVMDATAIDRVASIVETERSKGHTPVVVVSALGGVTDTLLALAHSARGGNATEVRDGVEALMARHRSQAASLGVGADTALADASGAIVRDLQSVLDAIEQQGASHPGALDVVAATG